MFNSVRRALGFVKVEESRNVITVSGIPNEVLVRLMNKYTGTTKVTRNILINSSNSSMTFHSFYAVEVNYLLLKIISENPTWAIKNAATKIIDELHRHTWLKSTVGEVRPIVDLSLLKTIKWKLKPHQLEFLKVYGTMVP